MLLYISFHTSAEAMATERIAGQKKLGGRLVPLPRRISASCGMAYEIDASYKEAMKKLLEENNIEWDEFIEI